MTAWRIFFHPLDARTGRLLLNLIELLLALPISNAKMERIFWKMSRVMTADQTSLREGRLKDILKMMEEGLLKVCNPILVIQMIHAQLIN